MLQRRVRSILGSREDGNIQSPMKLKTGQQGRRYERNGCQLRNEEANSGSDRENE